LDKPTGCTPHLKYRDFNIISVGHRHHAYVSNHIKTQTDQHATYNTLRLVPTLPR